VHILGIEIQRHLKVEHIRSSTNQRFVGRFLYLFGFFFGSENVAHVFSADEFKTYFTTLATSTVCLLRYLTFLIVPSYRVILFNFFVLMRIVLRHL
jgi:hypothetical protein